MSGHSKWATIKHKKGAADKARGKLFGKLIRQVEVAARQGGGDLDMNPTLRTMYQKARSASVPLDTIEKAIKRGTGDLEGVIYEQITYEGYAPNGVAILIEVLTDNRNRSGSDIRTALKKNGGSIAEPGAVAWQFERKGVVMVPSSVEEDDIMLAALDAGARGHRRARATRGGSRPRPPTCTPCEDALVDAGITVESADTTMLPTSTVPLETPEAAKQVLRVIDALEEDDDVQDVYANFDIPDSVMDAIEL